MERQESRVERLLYDVPTTAEALNLSASQIRLMIGRGELPVVRFGRAVRIPAAAVRALVERLSLAAG